MQIKITIIKDNGEEVELLRPIGALDSANILKSVEHEVLDLQRAVSPFLTETLIEEHQAHFKGKKIKMKNLNSAFVAIPLLFSLLALSRLQHNNKFFIGSFVNKNHACEKNTTPIKPGVVLRCESNDGKVFEYAIREEKITMIADVAGYGTAEPIQFNVALPNSKVVNLSDNRPAVVYISVLDNYEFASDVEWDYLSSYTQDGQGDETAIRKCITINQFPFSAKVRKITIAKVGDKSGVVTINFKVQFKKSN